MRKKAFITGITGQDGSYLAELLLEKGYEVHGLVRRNSTLFRTRIDHLHTAEEPSEQRFFLHYGDLTDGSSLVRLLHMIRPDEVYNLGAQSHVRISFDVPVYTVLADAVGAIELLEVIRSMDYPIKFYQASSSEMYGLTRETPQKETTPFYPRSPYACAKAYAHFQTVNYRESYGIFACSGILFNHESPRRGENFVSRKITKAVAEIKHGLRDTIALGNLHAKRDWGYAKEYVEAMWLMLQQDTPHDYVIATGESHSVEEFLSEAFGYAGLHWKDHVTFDERFVRPAEVEELIGDATKAKEKLGWTPKVRFKELVKLMVDADMALLRDRDVVYDHSPYGDYK